MIYWRHIYRLFYFFFFRCVSTCCHREMALPIPHPCTLASSHSSKTRIWAIGEYDDLRCECDCKRLFGIGSSTPPPLLASPVKGAAVDAWMDTPTTPFVYFAAVFLFNCRVLPHANECNRASSNHKALRIIIKELLY